MNDVTFFTLLLVISISAPGNLWTAELGGSMEQDPAGFVYQLEIAGHHKLSAVKNNPLNQLNQFVSDGCSGGLSAGWEYLAGKVQKFETRYGAKPPWEACCVSHDRVYHAAGGRELSAAESFELRRRADQRLRVCVQKSGTEQSAALSRAYGISSQEVERLYTVISSLMYRAVRIGGLPCTGLTWRWGYGWPECEE